MIEKQLRELFGSQDYQSFAQPLLEKLEEQGIKISQAERHANTRDRERLDFITRYIDFSEVTSVLDIGANSGFFSIELASRYGCRVTAYEGIAENANFIEVSAEFLGLKSSVTTLSDTYNFDEDSGRYEIVLCLNVLHHVGRYFGEAKNQNEGLDKISKYLQSLLQRSQTLIFQMGFNWKGNEKLPFFPSGLKNEMIDFVTDCLPGEDYTCEVGILNPDTLQFESGNCGLYRRSDILGEFGNRPLFIISKRMQ